MRLLLVVDPARIDFYEYLKSAEEIEYDLLWYEKSSSANTDYNALPLRFSNVHFWTDANTPITLLKKINPDKILFFEIIDLRQIALIVSAKKLAIRTFYMEHGAAGDKETVLIQLNNSSDKQGRFTYLIKRFLGSFLFVLKSKLFYFSVFSGFDSMRSYIKYFKLPFLMLMKPPNKVLLTCKFNERDPDKAVVFNKINLELYKLFNGINADDAFLTGVPFFDKYYKPNIIEGNHICFIDHPYLEDSILDWTKEHHRKIAEALFQFAEITKTKLYIKLHPRSNKAIWESYSFNTEYVDILHLGDFTDLYLSSKLILGFSSSLINGFICAKKNVVLLGWHPKSQVFGVDFTKTGLCHYSRNSEDLMKDYDYWLNNNLATRNPERYKNFILDFNYPFDGKATERVIQTILTC